MCFPGWSGLLQRLFFWRSLLIKDGVGAWPIGVSGVIRDVHAPYVVCGTSGSDKKTGYYDYQNGLRVFNRGDHVFAAPLWYLTTDPLWAVLILTVVDVAGFGPIFRKAYA